eukprot:scaffold26866_cov52-Attheya_sp.AAC.2
MGCCISSSVTDETFTISTCEKAGVRDFLADRGNCPNIVPGASGCATKVLSSDSSSSPSSFRDDWSMDNTGLRYTFTSIVSVEESESGPASNLSYAMCVSGMSMCPPIDFTFTIRYDFDDSFRSKKEERKDDRIQVRRRVENVRVLKYSCITGCVIQSNLKKGLAEENANIAKLIK